MSQDEQHPARPLLRVIHGAPSAEEVAVVTAIVAAAGNASGSGGETARRIGRWNDPGARHRPAWRPGAGAWLTTFR